MSTGRKPPMSSPTSIATPARPEQQARELRARRAPVAGPATGPAPRRQEAPPAMSNPVSELGQVPLGVASSSHGTAISIAENARSGRHRAQHPAEAATPQRERQQHQAAEPGAQQHERGRLRPRVRRPGSAGTGYPRSHTLRRTSPSCAWSSPSLAWLMQRAHTEQRHLCSSGERRHRRADSAPARPTAGRSRHSGLVQNAQLSWQQSAVLAAGLAGLSLALYHAGPGRTRRLAPFAREAGVIAALYALWQLAGTLSVLGTSGAMRRAADIAALERDWHLPSESSVQRLITGHPVLVAVSNLYYATHALRGAVRLPVLAVRPAPRSVPPGPA